ncbi:MFS transporter [Streptomyces sp. NBC_01591]|uniref:MFS transporter n=1 Tax=Streptomyces sp. NBC_01591 TaxID=2975888 RepID=UPI002DDC3B15|nr:MFS transporter [Streptomyces sp. NBC_01591]WSD72825.1 MFS transporter [Streptomyces sp. NBC_01591]
MNVRECTFNTGSGWRPGYVAAALVFAIGMAGTTLPTPLYGLYQEQIGFSELMVTVVFAVYAVAVITVLLVAGNYSDEIGRRPVLLCALALSAASAGCFLLEGGLPLLFAGRLLSGCAAGLLSGAATAAVIELAGPEHKARAGFAATAANMGGLGCGPLLSGILAQYTPWPLTLPFWVHLGLVALACGITWFLPETVAEPKRRPRLKPQGLSVPPEVKSVFLPASLAAFAGFALLGLFTAVAPSFAAQTLGVHNLAVSGAVVFSVFLASTVGQSLTQRIGARLALPVGCAVLVAGLLLVASSLIAESMLLLVLGALCGGTGQGLAFRAALTLVSGAAPAQHRGGTISAFFVVAYAGISVPVVGVGAMATWLGLRQAGLIFAGCVMLLAAGAGTYAARRLPREPDLQPGPPPTASSRF